MLVVTGNMKAQRGMAAKARRAILAFAPLAVLAPALFLPALLPEGPMLPDLWPVHAT